MPNMHKLTLTTMAGRKHWVRSLRLVHKSVAEHLGAAEPRSFPVSRSSPDHVSSLAQQAFLRSIAKYKRDVLRLGLTDCQQGFHEFSDLERILSRGLGQLVDQDVPLGMLLKKSWPFHGDLHLLRLLVRHTSD